MKVIAHFCDKHEPAYRFADCDCFPRVRCQVQGCTNLATQTGLFHTEKRK